MQMRARRRDRAARIGPELFLLTRTFEDCLERIRLTGRRFERALLIGCPDPQWPRQLASFAEDVDVRDPGPLFAFAAGGIPLIEDAWQPPEASYDVMVAIGTLDTVNDLPAALCLLRVALRASGLFIGALSGGDTLPQLRSAMRAGDAATKSAAPHVHPRIEASALGPLLSNAGFQSPVVDVDRIPVSYASLSRLVADLRAMAATNVLRERPRVMSRASLAAAARAFSETGDGHRTVETFEVLHFAAST